MEYVEGQDLAQYWVVRFRERPIQTRRASASAEKARKLQIRLRGVLVLSKRHVCP
jgi:hypothetical protein